MRITAEVAALIARLGTVHDCERAALDLVNRGPEVIPDVREFLLRVQEDSVYQPRQCAVRVLAALGAKDVLCEYLSRGRRSQNPAAAYAEEAVAITAARELRRWRDDDVFRVLLTEIRDRLQPGAIEALGQFKRPEALPYLVEALGDGVCDTVAEAALENYGSGARDSLIEAAITPRPDAHSETPSNARRRARALRLLAKLGVSPEEWIDIRNALVSAEPRVALAAGWLALQSADAEDRRAYAAQLPAIVSKADWLTRLDAHECVRALLQSLGVSA